LKKKKIKRKSMAKPDKREPNVSLNKDWVGGGRGLKGVSRTLRYSGYQKKRFPQQERGVEELPVLGKTFSNKYILRGAYGTRLHVKWVGKTWEG